MHGENGPKELRFLLESLLRGAEAVQQNISELRRVQEQIKDLLDDPMLCTALPETEMGGARRRSFSHLRDFTRDAVHLTVRDNVIQSIASLNSGEIHQSVVIDWKQESNKNQTRNAHFHNALLICPFSHHLGSG
jgi:hypothetical protein